MARARSLAEARGASLSLVPLLVGLLADEAGITAAVFRQIRVEPEIATARLSAGIEAGAHAGKPSQHYLEALAVAKTQARAEGLVVVLERHVLRAAFEQPSVALDRALQSLATDRHALRASLDQIAPRTLAFDAETSRFGQV
jgi:ATP-dependent Clp protease ATP-binding subunit ClpA